MYKLTVGLPVHNAMPYLRESMDSLLAQSYQDFEILTIDNGSTDGSLEYLRSVRDNRVRVIAQPNRGLTFSLNRMLQEANTPWLVRHDADDVCYPNRLQLVVEHIEKYPDAGMFYSYARYYGGGRSVANFKTTEGSPECLRDLTQAGYLLAICHPTVTLNVEKTLRCGGYRFNLNVEDLDLWWRIALLYDIRLIASITVAFRLNGGSLSSRNLESQAVNALYIQYLLLSHLWNLEPNAYESVRDKLAALVDRRRVKARHHIRRAHIEYAQRNFGSAIVYALTGLTSSPAHLLGRVAHEFKSKRPATNGVDPKIFSAGRAQFWSPQPILEERTCYGSATAY